MFTNNAYALLIGVDDYSAFDASSGQTVGTSDLKGSRNDVRTFWRLCRLLGMKPENIRVLASPPIDFNELEGATPENVAPATEKEILAGSAWLAEQLSHSSKPTGVITYSGHGDSLADHGLVLCPSDTTFGIDASGNPDLRNVVPFRALNVIFRRNDAAENLTVLLDTCHSGGAGGRSLKTGKPLKLTPNPLLPTEATHEPLAGRVLAAAKRDQVAFQSMFDGEHRGVFSWAVSAAIEQWQATQDGANVRLDLSYGKLVEATRRLLSALWFDQTPELHGPAGLVDLAVLHHGLIGHRGETKAFPDGGFQTEELDPGNRDYLIYTLWQSGSQIGRVLVTNTAGLGFEGNREYWYMTTNVSNRVAITFSAGTAQSWSTPPSVGTLSFKTVRRPTWTSSTPVGAMHIWTNPITPTDQIGMLWAMVSNAGVWSGTISWWHRSTANLFSAGHNYTLNINQPTGTGWFNFVSTPL